MLLHANRFPAVAMVEYTVVRSLEGQFIFLLDCHVESSEEKRYFSISSVNGHVSNHLGDGVIECPIESYEGVANDSINPREGLVVKLNLVA